MNHKKTLIAIIALLAILIAAAPTSQVAAQTTNAKLALRFADCGLNPLKNAYVKVYNQTANALLFEGRTDSKGWLNVTIPEPRAGTTYNMTVWWDPAGTDYFYVFEKKDITGDLLKAKPATGYNCTEGGYIVASVLEVKVTAKNYDGTATLDYYTTTVYYNWTNKVYSVSKKPASDILLQVPYNLSWTGSKNWTIRVNWDLEYLKFLEGAYSGCVKDFDIWADKTYANFTVTIADPFALIGPATDCVTDGRGTLTVKMDVRPFATQLIDWFGKNLNATTGYGIVKVMVHDANDPSKLLATMIASDTGYVSFPQVPNVKSTIVVYWLTHEITVNTTTVDDLTMLPSALRCQLVPTVLTLKDKRPVSGVLAEAKVYVTWPNLLTHDTKSNLAGVVQLPPYSDDARRVSMATGAVPHGSGYLPFGETKVDVYWSITPEQPASWVNVRSAKIKIVSAGTGKVDVYVDGELVKDDLAATLTYDVVCKVFDAMLNVVDLNGNPLVSPTVVLQHPTGAVSMVTASPGGALTLIQVPGGDWRVSVVYKNVQFKPYDKSDVFSINTNIYSAVTFKFPYVDAKLKFVKWGSDTFAIPGLNVTLSWTGNSTVAGTSGVTYKEAWKGTSTKGWANFTQIPVGVSVTVDAWTNKTRADLFGITKSIDVGPYETPITLAPENYIGTFHVYIYDVKVNFCDVKGNLLPSPLPYSMAVTFINSTTWSYANATSTNSLFYYTTTKHMYVGGGGYRLDVYWAGVRVYNGTVTIPVVTDPTKAYSELNLNLRVYPVSFSLYNWKHTTLMDKLNVTIMWQAANMTWLNETASGMENQKVADLTTKVASNIFNTTEPAEKNSYMFYMVTLKYSAENLVYIPVWVTNTDTVKKIVGTPISIVVLTIPGETVGVPKDVSSIAVGSLTYLTTPRNEFINGTVSDWKKMVAAGGLMNVTKSKLGLDYKFDILNFTGVATAYSPVWSYSNYVFDLKVAAYDMTAKVTDWTGTGLVKYTVDAYWKYAGKYYLVISSLTDDTGKATFKTIFWGNATTYMFRAYRIPLAGELPADLKVTLADDVIVYTDVTADKDDIVASMKFGNYIGLQALSANGKPLYKVFAGVPKYGLVYAIRYTPVKDTVSNTIVPAGTIAAFGYVDSTGKVYMPFASTPGNYTIMVRWLGVDVYNSYDKEVFYKIVKPTVFYTAFTDVFDVSFRLTDDVGRNLAGLKYTFAGGEYSVSGVTGSDGTFSTDLVPRGSYKITALWPRKDIKVLEMDVTVTGNLVEVPVKCKVYDATVVVKTPKGTLLTAATVSVKYPDDTTATATTTPAGEVKFTQIPIGTLTVTGVTWLGKSITVTPASFTVDKTGVYTLTTTNVYTLTVKVVGARGQGLGPTAVSIAPLGVSVETDESGVASVEVPAGTYTVSVNYRGIEDSRSVSVTADKTETFSLDVFATIFGRPFRTAEFFGELILLPIVIIVVLYLIFYEYTVWRRKRLAVVPPTK
ncbi:MAG: hypothetical protein LM601_03190 [Candidatus Verstraetearchaeota archaeon]|nr:hypothetical protein [Candidatus Verstraetearchaeota archaeon]